MEVETAEQVAAKEKIAVEAKAAEDKVIADKAAADAKAAEGNDDIDSRLNKMYDKFAADARSVVTTVVKEESVVNDQVVVIRTMEDYKKYKEQNPEAAEQWMMEQVSRRVLAEDSAKKQYHEDSRAWMQNERGVLSRHANAIK